MKHIAKTIKKIIKSPIGEKVIAEILIAFLKNVGKIALHFFL
jgi:hypothetical protein